LANWDVFHSERLEVERSLTTADIRERLARGDLRDDDLVRPAGTNTPWAAIADFPALVEAESEPEMVPAQVEDLGPPEFADDPDDDDDDDYQSFDAIVLDEGVEDDDPPQVAHAEALGHDDIDLADDESRMALPVAGMGWDQPDEDEAAAEFTLSRGAADRVEELDLAAMVDVAFQLVLFFLVTATTVLYKSLEVPKPNPESPAAGAAQGRSRTLEDLKNDYILVEIDQAGTMKIDREPVASDMAAVIERLRVARETTKRRAMLLTADFATPHRSAVLAYDAANEIGLGIAIARPSPSGAPQAKPAPSPAAKKPAQG
jgi:biopolymer transport protein ExbD